MIYDVMIGVLKNYYVVNRSYCLAGLTVPVVYNHQSYLSNVGFFFRATFGLKDIA